MIKSVAILGIWERFVTGFDRDYIHNSQDWGNQDDFAYDFELMQFTGLQDKNGKDIYEGDIKEWKFNSYIYRYVASWNDFYCGFRWRLIKHNLKQDLHGTDLRFDTEEEFYNYVINQNSASYFTFDQFSELIGNIYENPELLTK